LFRGIVVVFPVITLLLVQINALRYQSDLINGVQRVWLIVDLLAQGWFFARAPLTDSGPERRVRLIGLPVLLVFLDFCWLGTVRADLDPAWVRYDRNDTYWQSHPAPSLTDMVRSPLDMLVCPTLTWGCRFLRVEHRTLIDNVWDNKAIVEMRAGSADQTQSLASIEGVVLRDRSLRFAVLDESRLFAADLQRADLRGASLHSVSLPGAKLMLTRLENAYLRDAQFQGADFSEARMQHANLFSARLRGATLRHAQLQGANLGFAVLEEANLDQALLEGADLEFAQLDAASLTGAGLACADLSHARLQGASITGADFQFASLTEAQLQGAYGGLSHVTFAPVEVSFQAANLTNAHLEGADLRLSDLRRATTTDQVALVSLADLRGVVSDRAPRDQRRLALEADLAEVPYSDCKRDAKQSPPGSPPPLALRAVKPALASDPPDPRLMGQPIELIATPTPAYMGALSDYLVGELATSDPAIAYGITKRMSDGLSDLEPRETRAIDHPIACRLLATPALKLTKPSIDALVTALRQASLNCPAAADGADNRATAPEICGSNPGGKYWTAATPKITSTSHWRVRLGRSLSCPGMPTCLFSIRGLASAL